MVFVFEADSEKEEVRRMLEGLPLSGAAKKPHIKRMQAIGEMRGLQEF